MKDNTYNKYMLDMWESFSDQYSKIQKNPSVFSLTLLNMLRIDQANNIIDAGCGAGYLHPYIIHKKHPNTHLTALDFSQQMIKRSCARLKKALTHHTNIDYLTQDEVNSIKYDDPLFKQINYHPFVGSVEDLCDFKDNTFDVYHSNLCFQLVDHQEQALKEAYRVLKPQGRMGISLWGSRDNCNSLTLISDALVDAKMMEFYHNPKFQVNKEEFIQKLKDIGFKNILCWNQISVNDIYSFDDMELNSNPETIEFLNKATPEQREAYKDAINRRIKERFDLHLPFTFECIMVIAEK